MLSGFSKEDCTNQHRVSNSDDGPKSNNVGSGITRMSAWRCFPCGNTSRPVGGLFQCRRQCVPAVTWTHSSSASKVFFTSLEPYSWIPLALDTACQSVLAVGWRSLVRKQAQCLVQ
jgi:hypothetical protein